MLAHAFRASLVVTLLAGVAQGQEALQLPPDHFMIPAENVFAEDLGSPLSRGTAVYSSIPGPYSAFAAGAFSQRDDYVTTVPGAGNFQMDAFRFVGGVTAVNGILDFFFLDNANNVLVSFGVQLPSAGDFIYTITPFAPVSVAKAGQLQVQNRSGTSGRWFFTTTAASPGSNSFTAGSGSQLNPQRIQAFELQEVIPAPGAAALLGLGGLFAARRRRN